MAEPVLEVEDVRYRYDGTVAVDGVSLRVEAGTRLGLLGRNGSGKTTLLRMVSTQLVPDGGAVRIEGVDVATAPSRARRRLGVVFQSPALDGALTVLESLRLQAALVGLGRDPASRLEGALEDAGLADRAGARVATLSGGLARRLDLARALLHRPALALLDEPTAGLDPVARAAFWDVLDRRRADGAQVVATHDMDEAARCDLVVILEAGRVVQAGAPSALTAALGDDAVWLEGDDPAGIAASLGPAARVVGGHVMVPASGADVAALYRRPGVRAASVRRPTLEDVFTAAVGARPEPR